MNTEAIKVANELRASGKTLPEVVKELTYRGFKTKTGKDYTVNYLGVLLSKAKSKKGKKTVKPAKKVTTAPVNSPMPMGFYWASINKTTGAMQFTRVNAPEGF